MRRRGSFTVEAAMIMSVVWLAVFSMLYLCLFVHNRAWLTAAACEAAVCGSIAEAYREGSGYDTAELRSRELGSTGFFGASGLTADTSVQDCICVSYDMDTAQSFFSLQWHLHVQGSAAVLHPAPEIRRKKHDQEVVRP